MFCRSIKNTRFWGALVIVGIITMIFGITVVRGIPDDNHNMNMLMGMFTGVGAAFVTIGVIKLIHYKRIPAEKLKQEVIEIKDERNIEILRCAYSAGYAAAAVLFIILTFLFVWLNYIVPAFICIGAFYIQLTVFFISQRYFSRKI